MSDVIRQNDTRISDVEGVKFDIAPESVDIHCVIPSSDKDGDNKGKPLETIFSERRMVDSEAQAPVHAGLSPGGTDSSTESLIPDTGAPAPGEDLLIPEGEAGLAPFPTDAEGADRQTSFQPATGQAPMNQPSIDSSELISIIRKERGEMEGRLEEAYGRGFADGERRREEFERRLSDRYAFGLEKLHLLGRTLETLARHETLEIAVLIAKRIIQREIDQNPMILVDEIKNVASDIMGRDELTIKLTPEDLKAVRELVPDLSDHFTAVARVSIKEDKSLEKGDCLIDTEVEQINLSLEDQLAALKEALEAEAT